MTNTLSTEFPGYVACSRGIDPVIVSGLGLSPSIGRSLSPGLHARKASRPGTPVRGHETREPGVAWEWAGAEEGTKGYEVDESDVS
jgi:hypothetical protein